MNVAQIQPRVIRTQTGYRFDNLEAVGLPPRASQALLLSAAGHTADSAAAIMGCSRKNVEALIGTLRHKSKTTRKTGLISQAFCNGWLRIAVAFFSLQISLTPASQNATDDEPLRPRNTRLTRRTRKGDWLWDDETNQLTQA